MDPEHRTIMVIDIVGSSRWDNLAQVRATAALNRMVRIAFRTAGIPWWRLVVAERGDGMIVLVPPTVSKVDLLDPVVPSLAAGLRAHNATAGPGQRIRLRIAMHAGEVLHAGAGWLGDDVNQACRLVNGEPLYQELARCSRTDLVLVVSELIHHGVVRHGYRGIDPASYARVHIEVKGTDLHAWLLVSDRPAASSSNGLTVLMNGCR
jgi:hypothetical protein